MLTCDSEAVKRREIGRLAARVHVEFRTDAPDEFRRAAFRGDAFRSEKEDCPSALLPK